MKVSLASRPPFLAGHITGELLLQLPYSIPQNQCKTMILQVVSPRHDTQPVMKIVKL